MPAFPAPFSDELLAVCASLSVCATVEDIRAAIGAATADAPLHLTLPLLESGTGESGSPLDRKGKTPDDKKEGKKKSENEKKLSGDEAAGTEKGKKVEHTRTSPSPVETEIVIIAESIQHSDSMALEEGSALLYSDDEETASASSTASPSAYESRRKSSVMNRNSIEVSVFFDTAEALESIKAKKNTHYSRRENLAVQDPFSSSVVPASPPTRGRTMVSCIFITRKPPVDPVTGIPCSPSPFTTTRCLGVKDVCVLSIDVTRPLCVLDCFVRLVYEPLYRGKRDSTELCSQLRGVTQTIQAMCHRLPSFCVRDYTDEYIVKMCEANPRKSARELADILLSLPKVNDRREEVNKKREGCKSILDNPRFLLQLKGEYVNGDGNGKEMVVKCKEKEEIISVVSEKIKEWERTEQWVKDVSEELKKREWEVVCLFLSKKDETAYFRKFVQHQNNVSDFIGYLKGIKVVMEQNESSSFYDYANEIIAKVRQPPKYSAPLAQCLLREITLELLCCWVSSTMGLKELSGTSERNAEKTMTKEGEAHLTATQMSSKAENHRLGGTTFSSSISDGASSTSHTGGEVDGKEVTDVLDAFIGVVDESLAFTQWLQKSYTAAKNALLNPSACASISSSTPNAIVTTPTFSSSRGEEDKSTIELAIEKFRQRLIYIQTFLALHVHRQRQLEIIFSKSTFLHGLWSQFNRVGLNRHRVRTIKYDDPKKNSTENKKEEAVVTKEHKRSRDKVKNDGTIASSLSLSAVSRKQEEHTPSDDGEEVVKMLKKAFTDFLEDLSSFSLSDSGEQILWGTSAQSTQGLEMCMNAYNEKIDALDLQMTDFASYVLEQQCARHATANAHTNNAAALSARSVDFLWAFTQFQSIPFPRVKEMLHRYQESAEEQLKSLYARVRQEFVDAKMEQPLWKLLRFNLGVSNFAAAIAYRQDVALTLKRCADTQDGINEKGWHQLLILRDQRFHYWRLDDILAEFVGVPLKEWVENRSLTYRSPVHGCAVALAYLELYHPKERGWKEDPNLRVAEKLVEKDPKAKDQAMDVFHHSSYAQRKHVWVLKDFVGACDENKNLLLQAIDAWVSYADSKLNLLTSENALHAEEYILQGPILSIVEVTHRVGAISRRQRGVEADATMYADESNVCSSAAPALLSSHSKGAKSAFTVGHTKEVPYYQLEVVFPTAYYHLAADVQSIDEVKPLFTNYQLQKLEMVHKFLERNERRSRLAVNLTELLRVYYAVVNGEDQTLALLAAGPYAEVSEALRPLWGLRWKQEDEIQNKIQKLSEKIESLADEVKKFREQHELICNKIHLMQTRPCPPQKIVQNAQDVRKILDRLAVYNQFVQDWAESSVQPLLNAALLEQLRFGFHQWTADFLSMADNPQFLDMSFKTQIFHLRPLRLRMVVVRKEVRLEKTPQVWRWHWLQRFNHDFMWLKTVPSLYRSPCQGAVGVEAQDESSENFSISQMSTSAGAQTSENGYIFLLNRLPPSVVAAPLKAIEKCIQDTIAAEREWQMSQQFLNIDINVMQRRFGTDLRRWMNAIHHIHHITKQLIDVTQPNKLLGGIVMCVEGVQDELNKKFDQVLQLVLQKFSQILEEEMKTTSTELQATSNKAQAWVVTDRNEDAMDFLCEEPGITKELVKKESALELFLESERTLQALGRKFPENWIGARRMTDDYRSLKETISKKKDVIMMRHAELEESVSEMVHHLEESVLHTKIQLDELDTLHAKRTPAMMQQKVEELCTACDTLEIEVSKVNRIQDALGLPAMDISQLQHVSSSVKNLREVWSRASQVDKRLNTLCGTPFFELHPQWLQGELEVVETELNSFPTSLKSARVFQDLLTRVQFIVSCRRSIFDLRSDAMTPLERTQRHWIALKQRLSAPWVLERLTLQDILQTDPVANATVFLGVLEAAQGERRIEVQLGHISSFWESFRLSLTLYKKQTCLIRGWDTLFDRLSDDLGSCSGMRASPFLHAPTLISAVNDEENRLNHVRQIFEMLVEIQKWWVYLDGIFTGNVEIRTQLPHDTLQFERTSREFLTILPRPRAGGVLPEVGVQFFLQDEKLFQTLERLCNQITEVQHALTAYLDGQRRRFPRFFFVGDDDLLEIMGNGSDPNFLSRHLRKMFTGLHSFVVKPETLQLLGFSSMEGEVVSYQKVGPDLQHPLSPVSIEVEKRALYDWLSEAEEMMVSTLRNETLVAAKALFAAGSVKMDWIKVHPTQVLCLSLQLWWVKLQEDHFKSLGLSDASGSPSLRSLQANASRDSLHRVIQAKGDCCLENRKHAKSPVTDAMDLLLGQLASSVLDTQVQTSIRHRFEQMITIAVYQRDTSRALVLAEVRSPSEFEWSRVFRPYIQDDGVQKKESSSPKVVCCMADASITHGFEYIGGYERLVQTPLTDKCYFTLTQALHTRTGGSPVGPAGTGKTETVKALGMQLGRHVLVFNCDDTFDYMAVSRIFVGLCQVGAWGCFDEFNRLEERIMSALSLQIQLIQESLRRKQKEVEMHSKLIPLHSNVAIFITMNPGYAGRSNLPGNLKQLFRTVTMTVPDRETIAEVMLFAQGFHTAEHLSRKIVPLFRLCEDQFSNQAHYDFGLRALKSVLVAAGKRKRVVVGERSDSETSSSENMFLIQEEESNFMLSCIIDNIAPKLVPEDVALFYPLLKDFFPNHDIPANMYPQVEDAVHEVCTETGLTASPAWVEKICQLHSTLASRHGVMIVGPSGSGKTVAWKVLMTAAVRANPHKEIRTYVIEPKVLAKTELFGSLDITTREWKDGIFSVVLRKIIESENKKQEEEQQQLRQQMESDGLTESSMGSSSASSPLSSPPKEVHHWIVFDGDVDPEWVENLNSVLDDNKILTLPNGERLALPPSVRILFEVENLRYATPATVSRCGMIWFSEGLVPLAGVLTYAYQQLERFPIADARGHHLTFSMEPGQLGLPECTKTNQPRVSVHYGKTFHELIATTLARRPEEEDRAIPLTDDEDEFDRCLIEAKEGQEMESVVDEEKESGAGSWKRRASSLRRSPSASTLLDVDQEGGTHASIGEEGGNGYSLRKGRSAKSRPRSSTLLSTQNENPDAQRIQSGILRASSAAFGRTGLIAKGIALVSSSSYRPYCVMELNVMQLLQGVLAIFWEGIWHTFSAEQGSGSGPLSTPILQKVAEKLIAYAVVWGLGSPLPHEHRDRLAAELHLDATIGRGTTHAITEVEVDYLLGTWRPVRDRVQEVPILAEQVGANDTVIPTVDTVRHTDVLSSWIASGRSAILCGPPGSGKTMSINSVLSHSHEYTAAFLNFSSGTTVEMITKCLEQYCIVKNTAKGFVMTPNASSEKSKLLLFCDEINLPALDSYGTQSVLQLLRQIIECGGFFRARDNAWIHVERVQVIGACNPPTDPGRIPLPHRLLRWAPVLFVDFPSKDSLHIIFTTYCRAILIDNAELMKSYANSLASAMVNVYLSSQEHFTPMQQPHYLYSPRELSRWSRAIYEGLLTWEESERKTLKADLLVRLAVHEGLRVFSDRLVTQEERDWEDCMIDDMFREQFPQVPSSAYERPMLFSTILQRSYCHCPRQDLRDVIEKMLPRFFEEDFSTPLMVYDAMLDHIVRLDRVLRQPLGHMLMAGASGVGKSVIARLTAWMSGYSTFWLQVHRDYDIVAFEEDLRGLLRRSGCKREKICFIFDESNIMKPSFLEYMNALLASGEVPGLFEGEEWAKLIQDIREAVSKLKMSEATATWEGGEGSASSGGGTGGGEVGPASKGHRANLPARAGGSTERKNTATGSGSMAGLPHLPTASDYDLYRWFLQNVRERLHVVFTINPTSAEFSSRAVASPALFNRCTIDWLGDWEYDTLAQIARARIAEKSLLCGRNLQDDIFPSEESCHEAVLSALCAIHLKTCEINQTLRARHANSGTFITPRHFTDMGAHFVRLFEMKCNDSDEHMHHLRSGLKKLAETSADIEAQRETLKESEKLIAENSKEAQRMLDRIVAETDTTKKEKDAAEKLRGQLQEEEAKIVQDKQVIEMDLSRVEPALREAEAALNTVKPEYLREIRAYTTPPPMVRRVLEAVLMLMGERNTEEWDTIKGHIRREDFLLVVKAFKPTDVKDSSHDRVSEMMRDNLTVEAAYRASKAAGPLLQWVFAQLDYVKIYKKLRPLQRKVEELTQEHEKKNSELKETEESISQKEDFLLQLKSEYQVTTERIADLKRRTLTVSVKCERATTILGQLLDEQFRWEEEVQALEAYSRTKIGDCLLSACALSYIGFFDESVREQILFPAWEQCLGMAKIPARPQLSVLTYLLTPSTQLEWEQYGLPKDNLCAENAVIMDSTKRFPFLIDPTGAATYFLQNKYANQKIRKNSFAESGYLKQLEMAVRFGYPIILEDADFLDPAVTPLLNQEYRQCGGRQVTRIGPHEVDLSSSFKLFLVTRDSNYQPSPTLAGQTCLVNFTVTQSSLEFQCLHRLVLHERPDIDAKRTELLKVQGEYQLRLRVLEQKLLTTIAEAKGSLLEDDQLVATLASLKTEARGMQDDINNGDEMMRIIQRVERRYRPLSQALSSTFFALKRFSALSSFYEYNVDFIFRVIEDALNALPAKRYTALPTSPCNSPSSATSSRGDTECMEEELLRIQVLLSYVFNLVHHRVVRGMFSQDHVVLELRLAHMRSSVSQYLPKHLSAGAKDDGNREEGSPSTRRPGEAMDCCWAEETSATLAKLQRVYSVEVSVEEWAWLLEGLRGMTTSTEASSAHAEWNPQDSTANDAAPASSATDSTILSVHCFATLTKCGVLPSSKARQAALAVLLQRTAFASVRHSLENSSHFSSWKSFFESSSPIQEQETILPAEAFTFDGGDCSPVRRSFVLTALLFYTRQDDFLTAVMRTLHIFFDGTPPSVLLSSSEVRSPNGPSPPSDTDQGKHNHLPYGIEEFFSLPTRSVVADAMPELSSASPLLMVSDANYDPSDSVEELARESGVVVRAAAMGSMESTSAAQKYVEEGIKTGCWVLLKNVHLARVFIGQMEKLLHSRRQEGRIHENFRLFLTAERGGTTSTSGVGIAEKGSGGAPGRKSVLPINLLEECVLVVLEPPSGIQFSMMRTYGRLEATRGEAIPAVSGRAATVEGGRRSERMEGNISSLRLLSLHRLYMAAAWMHALVTERLFYVPVGWTKTYEFTDAEYMRMVQGVEACLVSREGKPKNTSTISPSDSALEVDWVALRAVIAETVYGGKISNPFDQLVIDLMCEKTLNETLWHDGHRLITPNIVRETAKSEGSGELVPSSSHVPAALPQEMSRTQLLQWISTLPEGSAPPQWLGLPNCVARVMRSQKALEALERLTLVQGTWDDELTEEGSWAMTANQDQEKTSTADLFGTSLSFTAPSASVESEGSREIAGTPVNTKPKASWVEKVRHVCQTWLPEYQRLARSFEEHSILIRGESTGAAVSGVGGSETGASPTAGSRMSVVPGVGGGDYSGKPPNAAASAQMSGNKSSDAESASPLKLAIQRESAMASRLAHLLSGEIKELEEVVSGRRKPAAVHRELVDQLTKEMVPSAWRGAAHGVLETAKLSLFPWLNDVLARLKHILLLVNAVEKGNQTSFLAHTTIQIGLLFSPGGFLTAFKQHYARERKHLSLENLRPQVRLESVLKTATGSTPQVGGRTEKDASCSADSASLCFTGITLYSAHVKEVADTSGKGKDSAKRKCVAALIDSESTSIEALTSQVNLWWTWTTNTLRTTGNGKKEPESTTEGKTLDEAQYADLPQPSISQRLRQQDASQHRIAIPLYSTATREALLDVIDVEIDDNAVSSKGVGREEAQDGDNPVGMWYERGVCMTAWNPTD